MNKIEFIQKVIKIKEQCENDLDQSEISSQICWTLALAEFYKEVRSIAFNVPNLPRIVTECEKDSLEDRLLSWEELVELTGKPRKTLEDWTRKKKFPRRFTLTFKNKKHFGVRLSDYLEWFKSPNDYCQGPEPVPKPDQKAKKQGKPLKKAKTAEKVAVEDIQTIIDDSVMEIINEESSRR